MNMEKAQARAFRQRWQSAQEIQQKEASGTTPELRWQQLNAAYGLGKSLQLDAGHSDEMRVYLRWAKLKENLP
jgi:hypothetical protein